ncbi:hypothetical protein DL93DRAFT_2166700 [Clavulina sp. PMI_390]|nr:hypothetical protein DL93DRAFT_2166700 [Clavulina sp. PMI_390]
MAFSFQQLMKQAKANTRYAHEEAAEIRAQQVEKERQQRLESEAREARERKLRQDEMFRELARKKREEEEAERKERLAQEKAERDANRTRDSSAWAHALALKSKASSSSSASPRHKAVKASSSPRTSEASTLTREEKRALKDPVLREKISPVRKSGASTSNGRAKKGFAGLPDASPSRSSTKASLTTKERLSQQPNTLVPLGQNRRDNRTIDEIQRGYRWTAQGGAIAPTAKPGGGSDTKSFFTPTFQQKKEMERQAQAEKSAAAAKAKAGSSSTNIAQSSSYPSSAPNARNSSSGSRPPNGRPSTSAPSNSKPSTSSTSNSVSAPVIKKRPVTLSAEDLETKRKIEELKQSLGRSAITPSSRLSASSKPPPRHAQSSSLRPRAPDPEDYDSDMLDEDEEEEEEEEDEDDGPSFRPGMIAALMGRNIAADEARAHALSDSEDDEDDDGYGGGRARKRKRKSYGIEELEREERRSMKIARIEDAAEEQRLRSMAEAKQKKKEMRKAQLAAAGAGSASSV